MFIRIKERDNGKKSIQIVSTKRDGKKIFQKIFRYVGTACNEKEETELKKLAETIIIDHENQTNPVLPCFSAKDIYGKANISNEEDRVKIKNLREEKRIIEGIEDIFGRLYSEMGFDRLIKNTNKDDEWNSILKQSVMTRIAYPVSKRRSIKILEEDFGIQIPLEKMYRMMNHVFDHEDDIKNHIAQKTLGLFQGQVDVLFFDVTTLYFESFKEDELRKFGFSKDCKFKETQVVLALITTTKGLPLTYEVFSGNKYEGHTLEIMVDALRQKHQVREIHLVADRAMFNEDNLTKMETEGASYTVAAKLKTLSKKIKKEILENACYKKVLVENETHWIMEYELNNRRLIVSYNADRAKKDASDRKRLVERLQKKVKDHEVNIKDLIPNYGTKKYLSINKTTVTINQDKIEQDAQWDGLHGVITNIKNKKAEEILQYYRGLWQIEATFRVSKNDLKMRPMYHWTMKRIKAHVAICFIALALIKYTLYKNLKQQINMSFEQIRSELLHVQSSIVNDVETKNKYIIPAFMTENQKIIYKAFGLKRSEVPRRSN